jgi:hypothetical protein
VRPRLNPEAPEFILPLVDDWVDALALHANVTVVEQDFDLLEVCDTLHPDLIVFEDLGPFRATPVRIANAAAHPAIPRAAMLNGDPFDTARPRFHRMVERYRIEFFFGLGWGPMQQMPELLGQVYSLPLLTNGRVHRDFGLAKIIPISAIGGLMGPEFYPWRHDTVLRLQQRFPVLVYAHRGYAKSALHGFSVHGEAYARLLNQCQFSLADTTRSHYLVTKHLEIPACGTILVSADTPPLAEYGFVDMQNCILGSGQALEDKIDFVARHPEHAERIRQAGHALVHDRYTYGAWRLILDWYETWRTRRPGESVVQTGLFGPFRTAPARSGLARAQIGDIPDNDITAVLRRARDAIYADGDLGEALASLSAVATWHFLAEPWLLGGIIQLLRGETQLARECFLRPVNLQAVRHGWFRISDDEAVCFDPVELAWLHLTGWLAKDAALSRMAAEQASALRHVALRRMRHLIDALDRGAADAAGPPDQRRPDDHLSIHWIGQEDEATWQDLIARVLRAHRVAREPALAG